MPLVTHFIFESTSKDHNVVTECVKAIGSIASVLNWSSYYSTLLYFFRQTQKKPQHEKNLVKVVCAIIQNFHFDLSEHNLLEGNHKGKFCRNLINPILILKLKKKHTIDDEKSDDEDEVEKSQMQDSSVRAELILPSESLDTSDIHNFIMMKLVTRVIPMLQKLIIDQEENTLRVGVVMTLIEILKLLPVQYMKLELPKIITSNDMNPQCSF